MTPAINPLHPEDWHGKRVGLLGGSFNPAHEGHRHISLQALDRLGLDGVWWLVSPQNPLKSENGMASQPERLASATRVADHPQIYPTDIETALGTRYSVDTITALKSAFADTRFVWLMGSDNLHQFHLWKNWHTLFDLVPVCAIARPPAEDLTRGCPAADYARPFTLNEDHAARLADLPPPALLLLPVPLNDTSSTALRAAGQWR